MLRRDFLASLGRAAGGAAMLRTMAAMGLGTAAASCGSSAAAPGPGGSSIPPPRQSTNSPRPGDWPSGIGSGKSVVVLGAGIAGMTAALELGRLGYSCTLLEGTARAGGRNRTLRSGDAIAETDSSQVCNFDLDDDLYFNAGPARIAHHHEFLLGYCREFGIALETFVNDNRAALLHSPAAFGGQPQLARRVISDTRGHIARLLATAIDQNALDQELSATDRNNILAMLRDFGDLGAGLSYSGSARAGFPGQEDVGSRQRGERLAPLDLQTLVADAFWQQRQDFAQGLEQQPTMLQPAGGMDRIANAFEAQVHQAIVYEARVTGIRKLANGVRVVYEDASGTQVNIESDHCVCTIPATVLRDIPGDFSSAHSAAISGFQYTPAVKVAFQSRRFWERAHNIYGGISWTTQDMTQLWYPSHGFGRANGIIVGSYIFGGAAGNSLTNLSPAQRLNTTSSQAANLHREFGAEVDRGISVAWRKIPFQLGAWGISDPGILLTADDRIYFAGEHLSILQGWQEGAILSAYHAIDLVVSRDSA